MSLATTMAGGRSDHGLSEASQWANLALEQVAVAAGAYHTPLEALALSSTTSGGNRIALPTDFDYATSLALYYGSTSTATTSRQTTTVVLTQRDASWVDAQQVQFVTTTPKYFIPYSSWLELWPSPNSAYSLQLRYVAKQPQLIASTDTPNLGDQWCQAWLYKTVELLHASRDDREGELLARNRFINYASTLRTDQGKRQQVRGSMQLRRGTSRD